MSTRGESAGKHQVFYRYRDATGRVAIVSSKDQIPAALRDQAQRIELDGTPENPVPTGVPGEPAALGTFHAPSFLLGFGGALLLGTILFSFRRGGSSTVAKLLGGAALMFVLAGAYFGWLRRTTGQSDSLVSSPTELVDDARRAVEKVERRRAEQEQVLEEIEREAKR